MNLEKIHVCACIWERQTHVCDTDNETKKVVWNLGGRYLFKSGGGGVICDSKIVGRRLQDNIGYTVLKKGGGAGYASLNSKKRDYVTLIKRLYQDFQYISRYFCISTSSFYRS